jgi:L-lysine exporter family protein LysE/ArgO
MLSAALAGFAAGFSLILAIGAQNAFVLRQGLARRHVFWVCLACALSDAVLIGAGVAGIGALTAQSPILRMAMIWGGAAFLFVYGALRLRAALSPGAMPMGADVAPQSLRATILMTLAFTWLNPHVYLDTLGLVGAIGAGFDADLRPAFAAGAVAASFAFFFSLGYGARLLTPVFARPGAWRALDLIVGLIMWALALMLLAT